METDEAIQLDQVCRMMHKAHIDTLEPSPPTSSDSDSLTISSSPSTSLTPMGAEKQDLDDVSTAPIFAMPVLEHVKAKETKRYKATFAQYGLLGGDVNGIEALTEPDLILAKNEQDPRVFVNVTSPSSTFICGSQGSGKSHTLSCLLENALVRSPINTLPHPLTALVFHYDTFLPDDKGSPCEAAFLSSNPKIDVRILCAPTNVTTIKASYERFQNIRVEPLRIDQSDLNTKRMLDLMAVSQNEGAQPLYLHTVRRILRDMRMMQQNTCGFFDYVSFKKNLEAADLLPTQLGPLQQRLDVLESFMPQGQIGKATSKDRKDSKGIMTRKALGNEWAGEPGTLTIVDLSCPCMTPESACGLFNICLSLFLENCGSTGRVIALDEAHKYMNASAEAATFTESLLATIRLQRHLGARIIVSTQEPTISPALLDLCSIAIVHRFTSPEWLRTLERHLAGAASKLLKDTANGEEGGDSSHSACVARKVFADVVKLRVGEALLFCPSAVIGVNDIANKGSDQFKRLGAGYMKIRVRSRITTDGGKSVMAI